MAAAAVAEAAAAAVAEAAAAAVAGLAAMKTYGTLSGHRSEPDLLACEAKGLVCDAPAYNTVFKYAERAELAPLLKTLVHESAAPLRAVETTFATDSTGFATSTYARWFDEKYAARRSASAGSSCTRRSARSRT
jgi:hypothetical protein